MLRPVHEAPESQVRAYLHDRGLTDDVISWKYYDHTFGQGRTRGFVWTPISTPWRMA